MGEEQLEAKIKRKSVASKESIFLPIVVLLSFCQLLSFLLLLFSLILPIIFHFLSCLSPQVNKLMDETERQLKTIAMLADDHQQASKMTKR